MAKRNLTVWRSRNWSGVQLAAELRDPIVFLNAFGTFWNGEAVYMVEDRKSPFGWYIPYDVVSIAFRPEVTIWRSKL